MSTSSALAVNGATDLRRAFMRTERARTLAALGLIAPLFFYFVVNFVVPVGFMLLNSVDERDMRSILPRTIAALARWDGHRLPDEQAFAALVIDMRKAAQAGTLVEAGKRLNSAKSGFNALLSETSRNLPPGVPPSYKAALIELDPRWGERVYWTVLKRTSSAVTSIYLLAALDLTVNEEGRIQPVAEDQRVFDPTWVRTFWMASAVTAICILLGYPLAYFLVSTPPRVSNMLLILVLLPFWTSLLARTMAWLVLLQDQGVVNDLGIALRLWNGRIQLIHNRLGVYIAMSQILLPYTVLPLYGIMRRIPRGYLRAAMSMGANPIIAFWRVYLPLTKHGIGAGGLFVFILAIGFYVTPALLGGRRDQTITYYIAFYTNEVLNWGAAAALGTMLLAFTGAVFWMFKTLFGLERLRIG